MLLEFVIGLFEAGLGEVNDTFARIGCGIIIAMMVAGAALRLWYLVAS